MFFRAFSHRQSVIDTTFKKDAKIPYHVIFPQVEFGVAESRTALVAHTLPTTCGELRLSRICAACASKLTHTISFMPLSCIEKRLAALEASLSAACARAARAEGSAAAALAETASLRAMVKGLGRRAGSEMSEVSDGEGDELRDAFARAVGDVGRGSGSGRKVFRNGGWVVEAGTGAGKELHGKGGGGILAPRKAGTDGWGGGVGKWEGKEGRREGKERRVFRGGRWVTTDAHG